MRGRKGKERKVFIYTLSLNKVEKERKGKVGVSLYPGDLQVLPLGD